MCLGKAKTLVEMAEGILFYFARDEAIEYDEKAVKKHLGEESKEHLLALVTTLEDQQDWGEGQLHEAINSFCEKRELKLKHVAQPCRVALTGSKIGPGLFEMMTVLGRDSTLTRLKRAVEEN